MNQREFEQMYDRFLHGEDVSFDYADLAGLNLANKRFVSASFRYSSLEKTDLRGTTFIDCDFSFVDFSDANIGTICWYDNDMTEVFLDRTSIMPISQSPKYLKEITSYLCDHPTMLNPDFIYTGSMNSPQSLEGWGITWSPEGEEYLRRYGSQIAGLILLGIEAHSQFNECRSQILDYLATNVLNR